MFSVLAMSCSFFSSLQSRFWWMSCCRLDVELQRVRFVTGVNDLSAGFLSRMTSESSLWQNRRHSSCLCPLSRFLSTIG